MNREIKFRGMRKTPDKEWIYGDLVRNVQGDFAVIPPYKMNMENTCSNYEVDPETIGQFTGVKDKNGKDIYEGDFVSFVTYAFHYCPSYAKSKKWPGRKARGTVIYNDKYGFFEIRTGFEFLILLIPDTSVGDDFEVVGNIHDAANKDFEIKILEE